MEHGLERSVVDVVPDWVRRVAEGVGNEDILEFRQLSGSSNDLLEVTFERGPVLMVKRGREDWSQRMFDTAEIAADLLDLRTPITVPRPITLETASPDPLQAYWRIPLPTLGDLWPGLTAVEGRRALHGLGGLLRRMHQVEIPGWGDLLCPEPGTRGLQEYLHNDLAVRLLPAVHGMWGEAVGSVERMIEAVPAASSRAGHRSPTLSHGDLHLHNVLCLEEHRGITCTGLLDLDNACSLPAESDLARFEVLHGTLFTQYLPDDMHRALREGYGDQPDPPLLSFFRAWHLANLGFYSALVGDDWHAQRVAEGLAEAVERMEKALPPGALQPDGRTA